MLRTILQNGIASNYTKKGVTPSYNPVGLPLIIFRVLVASNYSRMELRLKTYTPEWSHS